MPIRTPAALALVFGAVVLVASCSESTTGQSEPQPSSSGSASTSNTPAPPNLQKFYGQQPQWGSCDGFASADDKLDSDLECTKITVPIDYDKPDGDTAQIAISRSKATGDKIGSLLVNPGGPGASGLSTASVAKNTPLAQRFDVIGFDPRGVGASTPQIRCNTPQEADADRKDLDVDMSPAGIAQTEKEEHDYVARCSQRTGNELLAHVGTRDVVRDMDVIRGALGDPKMNYLGYSYGTKIGAAYAEAFPDKVRAMVLDGAVDPQQTPLDGQREQAQGFQKVFEAYANDCITKASCPLGSDPAGAVAKFQSLVNPLIDKFAGTKDPRGLSYDDAITGVQQALYSPDLWRVLTAGLRELADGRGDTLLKLADLYEGRADDGSYNNLTDSFNAIRCVDDPPITDRAAVGNADTEHRKVAPFTDDGRGTGQAPLDACAFWPVPNTDAPHALSVPGLGKTIVVSTTNDPATPYQSGVNLARDLGADLITYQGNQHTVVFSSGADCVDNAVIDYFTTLAQPPADLRC